MRIIVVSDSHGDVEILRKIENKHSNASLFIHAGDFRCSCLELGKFIAVRGNCDYDEAFPLTRQFTFYDVTFFVAHGNNYQNPYKLWLEGTNVIITGHTHIFSLKHRDDRHYILNPGSVTLPRDGTCGTYAEIIVEKDLLKFVTHYVNEL